MRGVITSATNSPLRVKGASRHGQCARVRFQLWNAWNFVL